MKLNKYDIFNKYDICALFTAPVMGISSALYAYSLIKNRELKKEREKEDMKQWVRDYISGREEE